MLSVLFYSFIAPLIQFMEMILEAALSLTGNYGLSIIILSIVVNVVILPFYALAESWQNDERDILTKMQKKRDDIKAVFKGDEQYFYLRTLYRQNHYNPFLAIRSSFGLLIQIPFFIGAYQFLSHYQPMEGQPFLFLQNLAEPDRLLGIANIFPIIMTIVNIASAYVYSRGLTKRDRIQLIVMAGVFLVLLYNSPSGLLLYWTFNNLISLIKNLIARSGFKSILGKIPFVANKVYDFLRIPTWSLFLAGFFSMGTVLLFYLYKSRTSNILLQISYPVLIIVALISTIYYASRYRSHFFSHITVLLQGILWFNALSHLYGKLVGQNVDVKDQYLVLIYICFVSCFLPFMEKLSEFMHRKNIFDIGSLNVYLVRILSVLVLLGGIVLQSSLLASAPGEINFSNITMAKTFFWAFVWFGIVPAFFYYAGPRSLRRPLLLLYLLLAFISVFNFLFYPGNYGIITDSLQFESGEAIDSRINVFMNLGLSGILSIVLFFLLIVGKELWIKTSLTIMILAFLGLSFFNIYTIASHESRDVIKNNDTKELNPRIAFSKTEKNTVILFVDRALAGAVPVALEEFPELKSDYDGFTWYKNTLSFGVNTATSLPALLGGYDYTPQGMINQPEKSLIDKVTDSWLVLSENFTRRGSSSYIEYNNNYHLKFPREELLSLSDNIVIDSFYDAFTKRWLSDSDFPSDFSELLLRDKSLFMFSFFRMAPLYFRETIYELGGWNSIVVKDEKFKEVSNLSNARDLIKEWSGLDYLPELSHTNSDKPTFSFIGNNSTHEIWGIDASYNPSVAEIEIPPEDLEKYGSASSVGHIYTNVAVLKKITEWLQWMKDSDVYDNTQIVIVSDHGYITEKIYNPFFEGVEAGDDKPDYNGFHPLLLFKPFGSHGILEVSSEFMTNADVPSLVLDAFGEFDNPYTGNPINTEKKKEPLLVGIGDWEIFKHHADRYSFHEEYYVKDSMLDPTNWSHTSK